VGARADAALALFVCPAPAALVAAALVSGVAAVVFGLAAAALVVGLAVGLATVWADTVPDHPVDPNNMAAKPASVRARVNLIVSICCSRCPEEHQRYRLFSTIVGRVMSKHVKSLCLLRR
jgi:hypothetical protein